MIPCLEFMLSNVSHSSIVNHLGFEVDKGIFVTND